MRDDMRNVVGGAAAGAVLGAIAGWVYGRRAAREGGELALSRSRVVRLLWAVIGVVRQVLELERG